MKVPLKIRFDGVYWFFRWPSLHPPRGAFVAYGSPDEKGYDSTDSAPLMMEAHQTLASPVDLACCGRIEVAVRNADRYPGTVAVELVLIDASMPPEKELSLGQVNVASTHRMSHPGESPNDESLRFSVPGNPSITSFNEVTIRFLLQPERSTLSPRIAIDSLLMVPR